MPPFKPMPTVKSSTVSARLQPVYEAAIRQMAGLNCPILFIIFLVTVKEKRLEVIIQSAIQEITMDMIHMAK